MKPKGWIARFVVYDAAKLTEHQRKRISEWLHEKASQLVTQGEGYAPKFSATYKIVARRAVMGVRK